MTTTVIVLALIGLSALTGASLGAIYVFSKKS